MSEMFAFSIGESAKLWTEGQESWAKQHFPSTLLPLHITPTLGDEGINEHCICKVKRLSSASALVALPVHP